MATFYLDYEGGNDANDGTTFANRWKTFSSGATAARIAPGDTIRVMASPDPTSLGQTAKWTNGPLGTSKNITGATNATPIVITSNAHGFSNGMYVRIDSVGGNTAANGLWKIQNVATNTFELTGSVGNGAYTSGGTVFDCTNTIVELTSAVTANVSLCETAWTASANVTATADSTQYKQGRFSSKLVIASAFTTGLAAYSALGAATDFSGYRQISFWIRNNVAIPNGASLSLRLCSDTVGAVSVNTIAIPAIPSTNQWVPITVDTGAALGASIQSVALYVDSDFGAVDIFLDNILACKNSSSADSLTLTSLIGKNTTDESWWCIQSINGVVVKLDAHNNALGNAGRGYMGTSETVTTWKRETIKMAMAATGNTAGALGAFQDFGTTGSRINVECGWDRTAMTTQGGETWIDGQNGFGNLWTLIQNGLSLNRAAAVRGNMGLSLPNTGTLSYFYGDNLSAVSCGSIGINIGCAGAIIGTIKAANSCNSSGVNIGGSMCSVSRLVACHSNLTNGVTIGGFKNRINTSSTSGSSVKNNSGNAFDFASIYDGLVQNVTTSGNVLGGLFGRACKVGLINCSIGESTEFSSGASNYSNFRTISMNHDGTSGNHQIFTDGGLISSESTIRKTASGLSWKLSPTSTIRAADYPLDYVIATVAVAANALVTVKLWMRRTNTALTGSLVVRGGQIAGVPNDVSASMTAIADTWEEVTLTFTPTEAGVVEIEAWAYGGTTHSLYIDDLTVTQA